MLDVPPVLALEAVRPAVLLPVLDAVEEQVADEPEVPVAPEPVVEFVDERLAPGAVELSGWAADELVAPGVAEQAPVFAGAPEVAGAPVC